MSNDQKVIISNVVRHLCDIGMDLPEITKEMLNGINNDVSVFKELIESEYNQYWGN